MGRTVILSPHLDDAVFSCWKLLTRDDGLVITICAGLPSGRTRPAYYDRLSGSSSPHERLRERREEDAAVLEAVGARYVHLDVLDAPYRRRRGAAVTIAEMVQELIPGGANVFGPAAIGGHPDHLLVRQVALAFQERSNMVSLFADLPYASRYGWPSWVSGERGSPYLDVDAYWERWLSTIPERNLLVPVVHVLASGEQRRKLEAMRMYRTQFPAIEEGPSRRLSHPRRISFEVTWRFAAVPEGGSPSAVASGARCVRLGRSSHTNHGCGTTGAGPEARPSATSRTCPRSWWS